MTEAPASVPMTAPNGMKLVPGRECGDCVACCIHLTIDDPALMKPQGIRCPHLAASSGCAIYADRPPTCRTYYCGWRLLPWVREALRPDRSDVLISVREQPVAFATTERRTELTLAVQLLSSRAVGAAGLPEAMAAAITAGVRVFVGLVGRPGYTSGSVEVTAALQDAVRNRDKAGVVAVLKWCWAKGRHGDTVKIRLGDKRRTRTVAE